VRIPVRNSLESFPETLDPLFQAARWPRGPHCPRCSSAEITPLPKSEKCNTRALFECRGCFYQFTVTTRTFMHRSHVSLSGWWHAITMSAVNAGKPSPTKVARELKITYKSAWFMCERIQRGRKGRFLRALLKCLQQDPHGGRSRTGASASTAGKSHSNSASARRRHRLLK
jgi:transposase-like protein